MTTLERPLHDPPVDPASRLPRPALGTAVLVASVVVYLWLCWRLRGFVTDDAWISVRYAENLANGHGFVWNPGGPRVEGFSNPLLVALEALAHLVGVPAMLAARGLGVLSGLAILVLVFVRGRDVVGRAGATAATAFIACSVPIAVWAVGGLETLPVALLLTVGVLELARPDGGRVWPAGLVMALLPWLRPEGLAAVAVLVAFSEGPGLLRRATRRAALRRFLVLAGVPVASQALLEGVRLGIYGHLLPNSVLYKSGTGEFFGVAEKFLAQGALVLILAAAGLVLARGRQRLLVVPASVYLIGSIGTLDSVNTFSRFFLPVWPPLALLAGLGVAGLLAGAVEERRRKVAAVALVVATGAGLLAFPPGDVRSAQAFMQDYRDCKTGAREHMAAWLRTTPEDTVFAISDAGLVPARAGERTVIDNFFLNEAMLQDTGSLLVAARVDEVLRRQPDVLVLASLRPDVFAAVYPTDQALHDHPGAAGYRLAHVAVGGGSGCGYHLMAFQR